MSESEIAALRTRVQENELEILRLRRQCHMGAHVYVTRNDFDSRLCLRCGEPFATAGRVTA